MAAFTLNLDRKILPTLVTCGKFDGSHACLAVATSSGNVLIHSPHRQLPTDINETPEDSLEKRLKWNGELAELQIGKQVIFFFFKFNNFFIKLCINLIHLILGIISVYWSSYRRRKRYSFDWNSYSYSCLSSGRKC